MILPKEFFDEIRYWHHNVEVGYGEAYDVFTIHFKKWWKRKKVIKIARKITYDPNDENSFYHQVTPSAGDLYNQLNNWAIQTWEEKLDSIQKKYEPPKDGSNVIHLKPKPEMKDE